MKVVDVSYCRFYDYVEKTNTFEYFQDLLDFTKEYGYLQVLDHDRSFGTQPWYLGIPSYNGNTWGDFWAYDNFVKGDVYEV